MRATDHDPTPDRMRTVAIVGIALMLVSTIAPATAQAGTLFCNDAGPGDDSCVIHCADNGVVCGSCPDGPTDGCDVHLLG